MQTAGHCEECAHKTAGIERALLNRSKQFGTLAEIIVMAFSRKFVVASYWIALRLLQERPSSEQVHQVYRQRQPYRP